MLHAIGARIYEIFSRENGRGAGKSRSAIPMVLRNGLFEGVVWMRWSSRRLKVPATRRESSCGLRSEKSSPGIGIS